MWSIIMQLLFTIANLLLGKLDLLCRASYLHHWWCNYIGLILSKEHLILIVEGPQSWTRIWWPPRIWHEFIRLIPKLILLVVPNLGIQFPSAKIKILQGELYMKPLLASQICCSLRRMTANPAALRSQTHVSSTVGICRALFSLNLRLALLGVQSWTIIHPGTGSGWTSGLADNSFKTTMPDRELLRNFLTASTMDLCIPRILWLPREPVMLP